MDLDGFSDLVAAFLACFPASEEPKPIFQEEYDEFYEALSLGNTANMHKEWADALWVWLLIGHYHGVDFRAAMANVAHKNYLKMKHRHLFAQDPVTGKWCKPQGWNEKVENGEIT